MRACVYLLMVGVLGCKAPGEECDPNAAAADGAELVTMTARDNVCLAADWYVAGNGAPALVLLHMVPPENTRADWPSDFIGRLGDQGWSVLAVDRRGAGDSGGHAEDAYTGVTARYDPEAAIGWIADAGGGETAFLSASNGTTAMLDYTLWGRSNGGVKPVALGFMTGGSYTENQNSMDKLVDMELPSVFTFSSAERGWSIDQQDRGEPEWTFHEYPDGDHGTRMFQAAPEVMDDLVAFYEPVFAGD